MNTVEKWGLFEVSAKGKPTATPLPITLFAECFVEPMKR